MIRFDSASRDHANAVLRPILALAPRSYLDDLQATLSELRICEAVARHDTAAIFSWWTRLSALQGTSDAIASGYDDRHGGITHADVAAAMSAEPSCPRPRSFWTFVGCGYRKGSQTCAEPDHFLRCPLPRHPLRKGSLSIAAYGTFLFFRDVASGDIVDWIDRRLHGAHRGGDSRSRARALREAVLAPLTGISGLGPKVLSMILADLLLVGDAARERWVAAGASFIAVDSLVHAILHRTGILARFDADHPYGAKCYGPVGCEAVIETIAAAFDARTINPHFPTYFPRFIQSAIWQFGAADRFAICNGNRIDDQDRCDQMFCPAFSVCDRVALHPRRHPQQPPLNIGK